MLTNIYILAKTNGGYLISACNFIQTIGEKGHIFQMLKDTHFSSISDKKGILEYEIVTISSNLDNNSRKRMILDHYNYHTVNPNIKTIMSFKCSNIESCIKNDTLTIQNMFDYNTKMDTKYSSLVTVKSLHNELGLIELDFMVNKYKETNNSVEQLYISNPTFCLDKLQYDYLIHML